MTVYADVLVVVNYAANLLCLLAAAKILGRLAGRRRLCLAALAGALGSLVIFLPYVGAWFQAGYKLLLTLGMTLLAFGFHGWRRLGKALFVVLMVSFLFAGGLFALYFFAAPAGMLFYNGVVYFDVPALFLLFGIGAAYLLVLLLERLFFSRTSEKELYTVTVTANGRTVTMKGLADTGSCLKEPFSGAPVIVCDGALAGKVRPDRPETFRVIPCRTVTGEGALEGFRPDEVEISGGGRTFKTNDVYIAASREAIGGEYQALLNPQLVDRELHFEWEG